METTLLQYLQNGIGRYFNILKSTGPPLPTDKLLTFNGRV
jgi:hypothetical protein